MTQLSLVEHALCPINPAVSLRANLTHEAAYFFTDKAGVRRKAQARVLCPEGLSAHDELYLWGLLALTFSQTEPGTEFTATPHYCLRQLGLIEGKQEQGGETYRLFRNAIERLSTVTYLNDHFYDPVRSEHCQVSFRFFGYRLPLNTDSSRAWRFYWDAQFFEICQATGSALAFDLEVYRQLDAATRRLYLLLKKMFWKRSTPLRLDVRHLTVDVLGFSAARPTWDLKADLVTCIDRLVKHGILSLGHESSAKGLFCKLHKGQFSVMLHRGANFDRQSVASRDVLDSPYYELLQTIGFEPPAIVRILRAYPSKLISEWVDITLAARERRGEKMFTKSAAAFFMDNIKHATAGKRTPPDWWRELRKQEEQQRRRHVADNSDMSLDQYLETEAREAFAQVTDRIFGDLLRAGHQADEARTRAAHIARNNLRAQFYREHPECRPVESMPSDPTNPDPED